MPSRTRTHNSRVFWNHFQKLSPILWLKFNERWCDSNSTALRSFWPSTNDLNDQVLGFYGQFYGFLKLRAFQDTQITLHIQVHTRIEHITSIVATSNDMFVVATLSLLWKTMLTIFFLKPGAHQADTNKQNVNCPLKQKIEHVRWKQNTGRMDYGQ